MKVIVGLGNPTKEYENTNHNAGFMVLDKVAEHFGVVFLKKSCKSLIAELYYNNQKFLLVKPQTYMNNSGIAVKEIVNKYKLQTSEDLMVISDDFDVKEGSVRIRCKSGNSTHNGIKSIKQQLGTSDFIRVKVSIAPKPEFLTIVDFVLAKIKNESVYYAINKAAEAVIDFICGGSVEDIMQKYSN